MLGSGESRSNSFWPSSVFSFCSLDVQFQISVFCQLQTDIRYTLFALKGSLQLSKHCVRKIITPSVNWLWPCKKREKRAPLKLSEKRTVNLMTGVIVATGQEKDTKVTRLPQQTGLCETLGASRSKEL